MQVATVITSFESRQPPRRPAMSATDLALTYARKFRETQDKDMALASITWQGDLLSATVNESQAACLTMLAGVISRRLPVEKTETVSELHTVGVQRKLLVQLREQTPPLSRQQLTDMLDKLLYWPEDDAFIESAFLFHMNYGLDELAQILAACRERDQRINSVLSGVVVEANEFVGYSDEFMERLMFAIQTRRDGEWFEIVAGSLNYAFGE